MKKYLLIGAVVVALLLVLRGINTIPTLDEHVKANWSQVENQYQRRADLIPNLVETVKGYAAHERDTLEAVINARAAATQTKIDLGMINSAEAMQAFQAKQNALSSALSRLMVVVERYPDLKADQHFSALQQQIEGTENRIAVARRDYIEAVRRYNTELKTFPGRLWHSFVYPEYRPAQQLEVAPEKKQVPSVKF
jgi:LemA protein